MKKHKFRLIISDLSFVSNQTYDQRGEVFEKEEAWNKMDVSKNNGTPKSSILIGFSIINHPFWGTPIFGNIQMLQEKCLGRFNWYLLGSLMRCYDASEYHWVFCRSKLQL